MSATHLPDHRYTVRGFVKDNGGKPLGGVFVTARALRAGVQETNTTDPTGYYSILLHLHDEDLGDQVRICALDFCVDQIVSFNRNDKVTERIAKVRDIVVIPSTTQNPAQPPLDNSTAYVIGAAIAVVGAYVFFKKPKRPSKEADVRGSEKKKMRRRT